MKKLLILFFFSASFSLFAQDQLLYQKPSKEILELVDIELAPSVLMDDDKEHMILLARDAYISINDLSKEELRLAGLRIDPKTNIGSRVRYYKNAQIKYLKNDVNTSVQVKGLPANPRLSNFNWSPDQSMVAMTNTTDEGVELWVLDLAKAEAKKLSEPTINANLGDALNWYKDGKSILVKMVASDRKELINTEDAVPVGPIISSNDGKEAQNRTYQDLLKSPNDEFNFEQLALSELYKVDLNGKKELVFPSAMYRSISFSPNGDYIMINTIEKPFSYLVTYSRFPNNTKIYNYAGDLLSTIVEVPLIEDLPKGFMAVRKGKRNIQWRADKPASIVYVEALDGGDPAAETVDRDQVYQLDEPFNGNPRPLISTSNRFSGITWANDTLAIAYDYWWNTRNQKAYFFNPSNPEAEKRLWFDRNYQDRYNDPGNLVSHRNEWGRSVLSLKNGKAYLLGDGYSEKGQFPFLDEMDVNTLETKRIYQSSYTDKKESLRDFSAADQLLLVRIESNSEYPNYFFRDLKNDKLQQLSFFENPFKSIQGVHKEIINYKRDDGVDLTATLYLPVGYDMEKKEKMPMIMWAYPREYKDKATAGQNTQNPNEFTYPYYGSPVYWVSKGYVILEDATFPIVGEGEEEPNDSFRKQLVANAKAAIDAVDAMGYIDRNRVAVGGHSYGAFMVANLLSHSDLFAAGIARSGAYNRTLTPFGFQSEERSYWEAPEVYYNMSPFMHADKMKTPLLLIHGEADNNSGTYPMQSERYFNALKGLGATARLVILPKESHGYSAKESILHLLWEQDQWLEKYVKNKGLNSAD